MKALRVWFGLLVAVWLAVLSANPAVAEDERRVALVIGNAHYERAPPLLNAANDARALGAKLERIGFTVDLRIDLTRETMTRALREFGERSAGAAIALVFYAGHGLQLAHGNSGENYLMPIDARLTDVRDAEDETVALSRVLSRIDAARTRIVLLDACRDNPLAAQMRGQNQSRSVTRGLARVEGLDRGTLIAFATDPNNTADDGAGDNSPFTEALLANIDTPGMDLRQVLTLVRRSVVAATNGRQTPYTTDLLMENVVLVAPPPPAAPPPVPAAPAIDPRTFELALWQSIQASSDAADFDEYLRQYPEGMFAGVARNRIAALRAPPAPAAATPPATAAVPPPPAPVQEAAVQPNADVEAQQDLAFWTSIANSTNPADFRAYLQAFPRGRFATLANARLQSFAARTAEEIEAGWNDTLRRVINEALRTLGALREPAGASFGPASRRAIRQFQQLEGDDDTGVLTEEQRDRLLRSADRVNQLLTVPDRSPLRRPAGSVIGADARFRRGYQHESGDGAPRNDAEAAYWYALAARDGNAEAFTNLGLRYARGAGVTRDLEAAGLLWRVAALLGQATAAFNVGVQYDRGLGVARDAAAARRWYQVAERLGHADAAAALRQVQP
jgi:uncharacterized caspase-like protein